MDLFLKCFMPRLYQIGYIVTGSWVEGLRKQVHTFDRVSVSSRHVGVGKVSTGGGQQYENCIYFRNSPMLCVGSL